MQERFGMEGLNSCPLLCESFCQMPLLRCVSLLLLPCGRNSDRRYFCRNLLFCMDKFSDDFNPIPSFLPSLIKLFCSYFLLRPQIRAYPGQDSVPYSCFCNSLHLALC